MIALIERHAETFGNGPDAHQRIASELTSISIRWRFGRPIVVGKGALSPEILLFPIEGIGFGGLGHGELDRDDVVRF